jgi:hypothetical protein
MVVSTGHGDAVTRRAVRRHAERDVERAALPAREGRRIRVVYAWWHHVIGGDASRSSPAGDAMLP